VAEVRRKGKGKDGKRMIRGSEVRNEDSEEEFYSADEGLL